jgi:hypothetical protein
MGLRRFSGVAWLGFHGDVPLAATEVHMIFYNPKGAPELACNECGCRWFDRISNCCYECGAKVPQHDIDEFEAALRDFSRSTND